jgi:Secretion system C-terminal sorting domain
MMNMILQKSIPILLFSLAPCFTALSAQNAVLPTGGDATGISGSAAYSVGEVAYTKIDGETGTVSLGVQQVYVTIMVGTDESDINLFASVYPNPVQDFLNLELENQNPEVDFGDLSCRLYDIRGHLLFQQKIASASTTLSVDHLAPAVYILKITRENTDIRSFKIVKTN